MIVVNVEDSPLATGNTVFDLLKRLPGVMVDNNNAIYLNGKQDVRILIDGRIQRLSGAQLTSVLMAMSSENISKVEVMNSPPVKYDADGAGGMINIVTKKVKIVGWSGDIRGGMSKGAVYRSGLDGSLNYKGRKFTLFSSLGYGHRDFYYPYVFDKSVKLNGNTTYLNEDGKETQYQRSIYYRFGADWFVSNKTTLGFFVTGGPGSTPMTDIGINRIYGYNDVGFSYTLFDVNVTDKWSNPNYNLNAEHKFDSLGSFIAYSGDYSNFKGHRRSFSDNGFYDMAGNVVLPSNRFISEHYTNINILTQKVDVKKVFIKNASIETGAKATFVNNTNDYSLNRQDHVTAEYIEDTLLSNNYVYSETIYAGYFSFRKQFKKIGMQIGARGENTIVDAFDKESNYKLTRNYFNYFPNFSIEHNAKNNSYQFKIDRRIFRPGYKDLNPFKSYQDNYSSTFGNPKLLPQLNYNFTFTHGYKGMLFTTLTYVNVQNFMLHYDFQNDTTKETSSAVANLDGNNYHAWGNIYFQKDLFKWWNFSTSAYAGYMHFQGNLRGEVFTRPNFEFNFNINNDILLPKDIKLQISGFYMSKTVYGVFYNKARWALDIGLKRSFFKNSLTVNINAFDVFYKNVEDMHGVFQGLDVHFFHPGDTRRVWVQLSYKFGKIKVQKRQTTGNDDEKGRLENKAN